MSGSYFPLLQEAGWGFALNAQLKVTVYYGKIWRWIYLDGIDKELYDDNWCVVLVAAKYKARREEIEVRCEKALLAKQNIAHKEIKKTAEKGKLMRK